MCDDCGDLRCLNCGWRAPYLPGPTWTERPEPSPVLPQHAPKKKRTLYARRYKTTEDYQAYLAYQKAYRQRRKKKQVAAHARRIL